MAVRTITQAFNSVGYRLDIDTLRIDNGSGELYATATGNRAFSLNGLSENFKQQEMRVDKADLDQTGLDLKLDTQNVQWDVPMLAAEESTELKRVNTAQWFRVEGSQKIRIAPPYAGKWYPDIAVLDSKMGVLYSFRSLEPQEEFSFELPEGAYYLKISNAQGMKMVKEGMWIESLSLR